jgi:hypothetical protein
MIKCLFGVNSEFLCLFKRCFHQDINSFVQFYIVDIKIVDENECDVEHVVGNVKKTDLAKKKKEKKKQNSRKGIFFLYNYIIY